MFTTAIGVTRPWITWVAGLIVSTTPTRKPPTRTSLPGTRFDPFGTRALRSYVGTNGSPLLALYARKTLTITISVVTAPTRTGLATTEAVPRPRVMGRGGSRGPGSGRRPAAAGGSRP